MSSIAFCRGAIVAIALFLAAPALAGTPPLNCFVATARR